MSTVHEVIGSLKEPRGREPVAWLVAILGTSSGWISEYFSVQQWELALTTIISLCSPHIH